MNMPWWVVANPPLEDIASSSNSSHTLPRAGQFLFKIHDLLYLGQKPTIDLRELKDLLNAEAGTKRVAQKKDAFAIRHTQSLCDDLARQDVAITVHLLADAPGPAIAAQPGAANLERAQRLLQRFLECPANGHRFPHAFHLRIQGRVGLRKFFESEPWHL